ncbi:MAG: alanyl-tRNA editing protein [Tissierellia bacterium]|nr:alanyl-tRNA editing protein [Tissierellia bacterium]
MMKTKKLYEDPYLKSHGAKVMGFHESGALILDETIFFPQGGGQLADEGFIQGHPVLDVKEEGEFILHYIESTEDLYLGKEVELQIDWDNRFHNMQQHTGEHILSGLAQSIHGAYNVGFHIGKDMMRVDYDKELSWEQLEDLERKANEAISQNVSIVSFYPRPTVLESLPYRSKKILEGDIRVVEVKGYDLCTCCGTHVRLSGEVGLLKILSRENYKGGVRLGVLCGFKALEYFDRLTKQSMQMSHLLCAPVLELYPALEQIFEDREKIRRLSVEKDEELIALKLEKEDGKKDLLIFEKTLKGKSLKNYVLALSHDREGLLAVFSPEEEGYSFLLISSGEDISILGKKLLKDYGGKGGGRGVNFQGWIPAKEDNQEERERIRTWFKTFTQQ